MISLLQAEWQKGIRHKALTAFTVWFFPVGFGLILIIVLGLYSNGASNIDSFSSGNLVLDMSGIFTIVSTFPGSFFGWLLPAAYLTMGFAGEYQWNTWKNIVPINKRAGLLTAKLISRTGIIMMGLLLTALIVGVVQIAIHQVNDLPYLGELNSEEITEMVTLFFQFVLVGVLSLLFIGSAAALITVVTRSVFGALLATLMFSNIEPLMPFVLGLFARLFDYPELIKINQYLPNYNLENLLMQFSASSSLVGDLPEVYDTFEISISIWIMLAWIVGLLGLAIWKFNRQDLA